MWARLYKQFIESVILILKILLFIGISKLKSKIVDHHKSQNNKILLLVLFNCAILYNNYRFIWIQEIIQSRIIHMNCSKCGYAIWVINILPQQFLNLKNNNLNNSLNNKLITT